MEQTSDTRFDRSILHALTFLVALCSFAYELVYSELLTVVYGGTVTQYGLTVGLFFFSLGIGSVLARTLDHDDLSNFFRTELLLAVVAPLGVLYILVLGVQRPPAWLPSFTFEWLARLPVVLVGLLSGFELPLLTAMVERLEGDSGAIAVGERLRRSVYGVVGLVFHVSADANDQDSYSLVLGMDYLGGLAGSLVYVFVLYPEVGLLPTVFVLGLLNAVAALAFVVVFGERSWSPAVGSLSGTERPTLVALCLVVGLVYGGVAVQHQAVDRELTAFYVEGTIEQEYPNGQMSATVTDMETTQYQRSVFYNRSWEGSDNPYFANESERCFRLGTAVQLCDSWAEPYHRGLVDVPMAMVANGSETDVLVVGGGDWIAVDHLREFGVSVDLVDIDAEFMELTKDHPWIRQYHDDAYRYDRLNVTVADAYTYLRDTDQRYDLVLLDVPGATDDSLLSLYAKQFYSELREHLTDDGLVATWTYDPAVYSQHHAAYMNTVRAAGFEQSMAYWALDDLDADGDTERVEKFLLLSPGQTPPFEVEAGGGYVSRYREQYASISWEPIPRFSGVEVNGLFDPNYDILIDT